MDIFVSWSGPLSKSIAITFCDWIEDVLQLTNPWMSEEDIPSGSIWFDDLNEQLSETAYGVLIVTERNQLAPWLIWEAGALFGGTVNGRRRKVVPILTNLIDSELIAPLNKFQCRQASRKKDMLALVKNINSGLEKSLADNKLSQQFERCWDKWHDAVENAISSTPDVNSTGAGSSHTFSEAATKFLEEDRSKDYKWRLIWVGHYINSLLLDQVNNDSLALFIKERGEGCCPEVEGKKPRGPASPATLKSEISVVIRVLKAAQDWGWIENLPRIAIPKATGDRKHFILTPSEQERIVLLLPDYMAQASIFAVNTGVERALLQDLQWSWLTQATGLGIEYFVVPHDYSQLDGGRIILLNSTARSIISEQKEVSEDRYVFAAPRGGKLYISTEFRKAWKKSNLPREGGHPLGISNLHWTFMERLERKNVTREDREYLCWRGDLFREKKSVTPDLPHLLQCLEKIATPSGPDHGKN